MCSSDLSLKGIESVEKRTCDLDEGLGLCPGFPLMSCVILGNSFDTSYVSFAAVAIQSALDWWREQQKCIFLKFWRLISLIKVLERLVSSEASLLSL